MIRHGMRLLPHLLALLYLIHEFTRVALHSSPTPLQVLLLTSNLSSGLLQRLLTEATILLNLLHCLRVLLPHLFV
jgi:hypothetical protein